MWCGFYVRIFFVAAAAAVNRMCIFCGPRVWNILINIHTVKPRRCECECVCVCVLVQQPERHDTEYLWDLLNATSELLVFWLFIGTAAHALPRSPISHVAIRLFVHLTEKSNQKYRKYISADCSRLSVRHFPCVFCFQFFSGVFVLLIPVFPPSPIQSCFVFPPASHFRFLV